MTVKLLTEQHLEFLSLKEGCTGSSESTRIKMPHCWKSLVTAQMASFKRMTTTLFLSKSVEDDMHAVKTDSGINESRRRYISARERILIRQYWNRLFAK